MEIFVVRNLKTTPYTPQQNGIAERMNNTLMERARSMLIGVGLGQELWAEAMETTCYLVNRSLSSTNNVNFETGTHTVTHFVVIAKK